jgi:hypothetical protein
VDDDEGQAMKRTIFFAIAWLALSAAALPQAPDTNAAEHDTPASVPIKRLKIEVTGGDKNVAIENASVYLKYVEEKKLGKDRKYALNVKTNRDGSAHIPDPPLGKVLIQIVADGWKTYGKYYELTNPETVIKIHLDRPPKWY